MLLNPKNLNTIIIPKNIYFFSLKKEKIGVLCPDILIKLNSAIFRRNSIFDPGSKCKIEIKQISF